MATFGYVCTRALTHSHGALETAISILIERCNLADGSHETFREHICGHVCLCECTVHVRLGETLNDEILVTTLHLLLSSHPRSDDHSLIFSPSFLILTHFISLLVRSLSPIIPQVWVSVAIVFSMFPFHFFPMHSSPFSSLLPFYRHMYPVLSLWLSLPLDHCHPSDWSTLSLKFLLLHSHLLLMTTTSNCPCSFYACVSPLHLPLQTIYFKDVINDHMCLYVALKGQLETYW